MALKDKLVKEAKELLLAKSDQEKLGELADILELIDGIVADDNLSKIALKKIKTQKRNTRGGFNNKLFLEYVDEE